MKLVVVYVKRNPVASVMYSRVLPSHLLINIRNSTNGKILPFTYQLYILNFHTRDFHVKIVHGKVKHDSKRFSPSLHSS